MCVKFPATDIMCAKTEVADNTYRDGSSELNNTEASFVEDGGVSVDQRKMNAVRAYFEWLPIRQVDMADDVSLAILRPNLHVPYLPSYLKTSLYS